MTVGVVDTTVVIHLFRKNAAALQWMQIQRKRLSITPFTWLEVIYGAGSKGKQAACIAILQDFDVVYPLQEDLDWAMETMAAHRLSHGVAVLDCLIASVCHRLQVPLYTDNVAHFLPMLDSQLVIKPY